MFSNLRHIAVGPRLTNDTSEYLSTADVIWGEEYIDQESYTGFDVTKRAVEETLQTALFSSLRPGFRSWSHHSYPEFLAACYVHRTMSFEQMVSLITYSDGTHKLVVPQLQETAAWLASMDSRIFELIVSTDPELLLRSSVMLDEEDQKRLLTQRLLEHYQRQEVGRFDLDLQSKLSKLNHPLLTSQLSSHIRNRDQKRYLREKAIEIALACKLYPLASGFADIALDQSEDPKLREEAAFAAASIGDKNVRIRLKPLTLGAAGDDPDEELKGYGLKALWPDLIAAQEVFPLITPPKNKSFSGSYHSFIFSDLIKHLDPHDLPKALSEVGKPRDDFAWGLEFPDLEDQIILKALEHLEVKGVASSLTRAIWRRLKRAGKVVTEKRSDRFRSLIQNETIRRALLLELLRVTSSDSDIARIAIPEKQLVLGSDLPWILTRIRKARTEKTKLKFGYLAFLVFDWRNLEHICLMLDAYEAGELLGHRFELLFSGIVIDSPEGQQLKTEHEALQRRQPQAKLSVDDLSLQALISKQLAEVESGSCDAWVDLTITLTGSPGAHPDNSWFDELEMTDQRGWINATEKTRGRITRAACSYLCHFEFDQTHWKNKPTFGVFAGCKAIALLLANTPGAFENAAARDLWVKWTPAVLTVAEYHNKNENTQRQMVKLAYHHAPDTVLGVLSILIGNSAPRNAYAILDKFSGFWDGRISDIVVKQAEDRQLAASGLGPLIEVLFEHDTENARKLIKLLISKAFTLEPDEVREAKAAEAISVCLGQADNQCLNLAWTAIRRSSKLGRRALERSVATMRTDKMRLHAFGEKTLAEMYIWLEKEYPPETSPHDEAAWAASQGGINDRVSLLKSSILTHLAGRGSQAAITSLEEVVHKLPDSYGPKLALVDARQARRDRLWIPAEPKQIRQLIMDQSKRLVKNEAELIDLLIEELRAMEKKLHGDTRTVKYLWDKRGEAFAPRPEEDFSDWIKMHLEQNISEKGIIAQREVRIRRERADVFVTAIKQDHLLGKYEELKVVIEVKCCWSDALETVMETQLVDSYLKNTEYGGGIFVVGWYYCDKWDKTDYRRGNAQRHWMGDPQTFFDQQAAALSTHEFLVRSFVVNTALD
ncbi:MAG: hypothetical protein WCG09_03330 [Halobacteriota archaeon]